MRRVSQILLILAIQFLPEVAPAGCPSMGALDATCAIDASSIEGCTNSIWYDYQGIKYAIDGLQLDPKHSSKRLKSIHIKRLAPISKIGLLSSASAYTRGSFFGDCNTTSKPTWWDIERCKTQLRSTQQGMILLSKPEVVDALSLNSREWLKITYTKQAAQYKGQLDRIAALWAGDPSVLCSKTYASISACQRVIAMDTDALRRQVFPVYRCRQLVPGQFVTAASYADEEARRVNDGPPEKMIWRMSRFPFPDAVRYYQDRLDEEKLLLSQAQVTL